MVMITSDILRLIAAGGGIKVNCKKHITSDIVRMAAAAKTGGGILILQDCENIITSDKVRIAAAGGGHVIFDLIV